MAIHCTTLCDLRSQGEQRSVDRTSQRRHQQAVALFTSKWRAQLYTRNIKRLVNTYDERYVCATKDNVPSRMSTPTRITTVQIWHPSFVPSNFCRASLTVNIRSLASSTSFFRPSRSTSCSLISALIAFQIQNRRWDHIQTVIMMATHEMCLSWGRRVLPWIVLAIE